MGADIITSLNLVSQPLYRKSSRQRSPGNTTLPNTAQLFSAFSVGSTLPRVAVNLSRRTWRGRNVKQCSSIADIESEMERRSGGSQQPELAPCYWNLLLRISRCTACWNRRRKLSLARFLPSSVSSPLSLYAPPSTQSVYSSFRGKSFAGRQFKVQDRTMALYISIPQLRRRFSPGLDKKKGTLVRDDQPRETVAKDGAGIMSRIGREGCKPPSKEVEEFCSFCRVFVCPFIYHSFFYSDVLLGRFNVHAVKLLYS